MKRAGIAVMGLLLLGGCSGHAPETLGIVEGRLAPCPDSPNCVSSMASGSKKYIAPFPYTIDREVAKTVLKDILNEQGGATLMQDIDEYLHVEFRTKFLGFVDDVEFYFPAQLRQIEIRSASRLGYWDLGTNRRRMEMLRKEFIDRTSR